jgi:hypothetical protein
MSVWYYTMGGQRQGPVTTEALQAMLRQGQLPPHENVWREGMANWAPAYAVPEVAPPTPAGMPPMPMGYAGGYPMPGQYAPPRDMGQDAGMRMLLPVGRSGWAIAAGYLGLFAFIILPAPLAVIISIVAIIDIRKHPEKHGMGRAIFGLIAGLLGSAVLAMGIVANLVRHH